DNYRSNVRRCPVDSSLKFPSEYTRLPETKVCTMEDLNVCPSNGDQPHLDKMVCLVTVCGRFRSTSTKSAQYPSRINPRRSNRKQRAVLCAVFSTICSRPSLPA